jgi:hypothetical protein
MKNLSPHSVTLPFAHPEPIGLPLLSFGAFNMVEVWKELSEYPGYAVSSFGRVKSFNERFEKIRKNVNHISGYYYVRLCKNGIKKTIAVHKLVSMAFLNHIPCGMQKTVNHKDFNKLNNYVNNLEIVTNRENNNRKHLKHSSQYTGVSWNKSKNKWEVKIYFNKKLHHLGRFENEYDAHLVYENKLLTLTKTI